MIIKDKQNIDIKYTSDITCDSCGESCKVDEVVIDNEKNPKYGQKQCYFEYMSLEASWGYHSNKDMQHWSAHMCEKCVDEKLPFINFNKGKTRFTTKIENT